MHTEVLPALTALPGLNFCVPFPTVFNQSGGYGRKWDTQEVHHQQHSLQRIQTREALKWSLFMHSRWRFLRRPDLIWRRLDNMVWNVVNVFSFQVSVTFSFYEKQMNLDLDDPQCLFAKGLRTPYSNECIQLF